MANLTMSTRDRSRLAELIRGVDVCMLTTMTPDGRHVARPMGLPEQSFDSDLWLFAREDAGKIHDIEANPQVNVSFCDQEKGVWASISAAAEVVRDHAVARKLWTPRLKSWFPDELDTDGLILIKAHPESADYWAAPGSSAVSLIDGEDGGRRVRPSGGLQ